MIFPRLPHSLEFVVSLGHETVRKSGRNSTVDSDLHGGSTENAVRLWDT
jgi:hypothetical protein